MFSTFGSYSSPNLHNFFFTIQRDHSPPAGRHWCWCGRQGWEIKRQRGPKAAASLAQLLLPRTPPLPSIQSSDVAACEQQEAGTEALITHSELVQKQSPDPRKRIPTLGIESCLAFDKESFSSVALLPVLVAPWTVVLRPISPSVSSCPTAGSIKAKHLLPYSGQSSPIPCCPLNNMYLVNNEFAILG